MMQFAQEHPYLTVVVGAVVVIVAATLISLPFLPKRKNLNNIDDDYPLGI